MLCIAIQALLETCKTDAMNASLCEIMMYPDAHRQQEDDVDLSTIDEEETRVVDDEEEDPYEYDDDLPGMHEYDDDLRGMPDSAGLDLVAEGKQFDSRARYKKDMSYDLKVVDKLQ